MRSIRIHEFGGPDVLRIEETETPIPGAGEVRLRVKAIGINRTEATFRTGRSAIKPALPSHIGFEAAGEIDEIGPGVTGFSQGDRVAVIPAYGVNEYGFYGETCLAPARSLVAVPEGVTWQEAAATWVAFATAWSGLVNIVGISENQTVLISAASSSVGLAAIQVARAMGAVPVALTRTSTKADVLRAHGAAAVVAIAERDVATEVRQLTSGRGADAVFDAVGGPGFAQLVEASAPGGKLVIYGMLNGPAASFPVMPMLGRGLTIRGFGLTSVTRDDAKLEKLRQFIGDRLARGVFQPIIAQAFPFEQIAEAHRALEAGNQVGKIVVTV